MKKLLFITLISSFFFSCSKDEESTDLKQIKIITYGGSPDEAIKFCDYEDGKLVKVSKYNANNFFTGSITYTYYSNGLLNQINNRKADNTGIEGRVYIYDNSGRLMHQKYEGTTLQSYYNINYTYNPDNTITAVRSGHNSGTKTYYLNSSQLIYKEVSDNTQLEMTFEGINPVSMSNGFSTTTFEYDNSNNPALLNNKNKDEAYTANAVLRADDLTEAANYATKYLIKKSNGSSQINSNNTYVYTFNGNGLPATRVDYYNGELVSEVYYIY